MYNKFDKFGLNGYPSEIRGRFNSFITTQFDDSLSVEMQLRSIIKWAKDNFDETVNQTNHFIDFINDLIEYMNEFIETFDDKYQETILDKMQEWYDNGELEVLINESLDSKYNEMDQRLTTQLEQKASDEKVNALSDSTARKTYVDVELDKKRDKTTKIEMEDVSNTLLNAITGDTEVNVLSTPSPESVTMETLALETKEELMNRTASSFLVTSRQAREVYFEINQSLGKVYINIHNDGLALETYYFRVNKDLPTILADLGVSTVTSPKGITNCIEMIIGSHFVYNIELDQFEIVGSTRYDANNHVNLAVALTSHSETTLQGALVEKWRSQMILESKESAKNTLDVSVYTYSNQPIEFKKGSSSNELLFKIGDGGIRFVYDGRYSDYFTMDIIATDIGKTVDDGFIKMLNQEFIVFDTETEKFILYSMNAYKKKHVPLLLNVYGFAYGGKLAEIWQMQKLTSDSDTALVNLINPHRHKQHYIENLKDAIPNVEALQDANTTTFSFNTDVHYRESRPYSLEQSYVLGSLQDFIPIDFIGITGDFIDGDVEKVESRELLKRVMTATEFYNKTPLFTVKGNHDSNNFRDNNGLPDKYFTNKEMYQMITKPIEKYGIVKNESDPYGGYYYKDFENKKIRTIWLNTHQFSGDDVPTEVDGEGIVQPIQSKWFAEVALNVPSDYHVLVFSHDVPYRSEEFNHNYGLFRGELLGIAEAFKNGGAYQTDNINVTYDGVGNFVGFFGGHAHLDAHVENSGINNFIATSTYAVQKYTTEPVSPVRETDGVNTLSLNIFVLNTDTRTVNVVKSGSGENRLFTY